MILADKIIDLRKKAGWSQEELAEKLAVTRQSVSKWEGAQSIPDMEKILQMSRIFGVTIDFLLKDEMETAEAAPETETTAARRVTMEEASRYLELRRQAAPKMALATLLCVLSPAALLHIPGLYRLVPGVFVKSTRSVFGPAAGFDSKELQVGNGIWRVDMVKCPYHDTCVAYGCPELCCCFCDSDDISYTGLHPKLIWHRTKTLGRGDDRCDFCIKIMK